MSARAWQARRFGRDFAALRVSRAERARTRRVEQLSRRVARRQDRMVLECCAETPWANPNHDVMADVRAAGIEGVPWPLSKPRVLVTMPLLPTRPWPTP